MHAKFQNFKQVFEKNNYLLEKVNIPMTILVLKFNHLLQNLSYGSKFMLSWLFELILVFRGVKN